MMLRLDQIKPGDLLLGWHALGAGMGMEPVYHKVLRLGRVKILVRSEFGNESWAYPGNFSKSVKAEEIAFVVWK